MVSASADPNEVDPDSSDPPLMVALDKRASQVVELLLKVTVRADFTSNL